MTLLEFLSLHHGGHSAARRLLDTGSVRVHGRINLDPAHPLVDGDLVGVGKRWARVVGDA